MSMTSEDSESDSLGMEDSLLSMTHIGAGGFIDSGDLISSRSGADSLDNGGDLRVGDLESGGDFGIDDVGIGDVGTGDVGTGDVGTGDVGTGDVGTGDVGIGDLGTDDLVTDDLGTVDGVLTSTPKVSSSLKSASPVSNGSVDSTGPSVMEPG
jgi:hypothetical protein